MEKRFEIQSIDNDIVIIKDNSKIIMDRGCDGDYWFHSPNGNTELNISFYSRMEPEEDECYKILNSLMKSMFGRYVLDDDRDSLPDDFVNFEDKIVTWHSDCSLEDILQFQHSNKEIKIRIFKNDEIDYNEPIRIRIRTTASPYYNYYEEISKFYREIGKFARGVTNQDEQNAKRLSLNK